jgi:hypothetical protein
METITVHPQNKEQLSALEIVLKAMNIPFEKEEFPYNSEFVAKIKRGEKAAKEGKGMKVDVANLWKWNYLKMLLKILSTGRNPGT